MDYAVKKKKDKKSKHKKEHKEKRKRRSHSHDEELEGHSHPPLGGLKITFKFGGIKNSVASPIEEDEDEHEPDAQTVPVQTPKKRASEEEEQWLEALEEGNLNDRGDLVTDQAAPLTARQVSIQNEAARTEVLIAAKAAAATVTWEAEETDESIAKKQEASRKRKLISEKQREEEKLETIQKLLQKQTSSRLRKDEIRRHHLEQNGNKATILDNVSYTRYVINRSGRSLSLPASTEFPMKPSATQQYPPPRETCSRDGCSNLRRYADSSSGRALCSLGCYKKIQHGVTT
eukprot:m.261017 g.261017  ORF g.261017 m.261017 type:complete len:289 (+) comp41128_c0_seq1:72-938(+)